MHRCKEHSLALRTLQRCCSFVLKLVPGAAEGTKPATEDTPTRAIAIDLMYIVIRNEGSDTSTPNGFPGVSSCGQSEILTLSLMRVSEIRSLR